MKFAFKFLSRDAIQTIYSLSSGPSPRWADLHLDGQSFIWTGRPSIEWAKGDVVANALSLPSLKMNYY